jgi:hypothetical protein
MPPPGSLAYNSFLFLRAPPDIAEFIKVRRSTKGVDYHLEELALRLNALADRLQNVELN